MNDKITMVGKHKARVIDEQFGYTASGNPQVALMFELSEDGPLKGRTISWFGGFNEGKQRERTFDSLRYCGWRGDDLEDLTGVRDNEVELVINEEEYEGKKKLRVQWINHLAIRTLDMKKKMGKGELTRFAAEMREHAEARRRESPGGRNGAQPAKQQSFVDPRYVDHGPGAEAPYEDDGSVGF